MLFPAGDSFRPRPLRFLCFLVRHQEAGCDERVAGEVLLLDRRAGGPSGFSVSLPCFPLVSALFFRAPIPASSLTRTARCSADEVPDASRPRRTRRAATRRLLVFRHGELGSRMSWHSDLLLGRRRLPDFAPSSWNTGLRMMNERLNE